MTLPGHLSEPLGAVSLHRHRPPPGFADGAHSHDEQFPAQPLDAVSEPMMESRFFSTVWFISTTR